MVLESADFTDNKRTYEDLKPMNIFRKGNLLKIGDFGLSKSLDESTAKTIAGTPKYMVCDQCLA